MKRPKKRSRTAPVKIELVVEDAAWRRVPGLESSLRKAVRHTLKSVAAGRGVRALTLLLSDDGRLCGLNRDFRGKNKPTNVLSFAPFPREAGYLGDIAIAHGVCAREAGAEGKSLTDHALHLAVHGTLHLLGYDHDETRDAEKMEMLETKILDALDIADPYAPRRRKVA